MVLLLGFIFCFRFIIRAYVLWIFFIYLILLNF